MRRIVLHRLHTAWLCLRGRPVVANTHIRGELDLAHPANRGVAVRGCTFAT